jgi:hypothetical protein
MKLTFRSNSYEIPAPILLGSASLEQPESKLIYWGHTYDYTPPPAVVSEAIVTNSSTVNLIYRGNTYERNLQTPKSHQKPHAINWRYQIPQRSSF